MAEEDVVMLDTGAGDASDALEPLLLSQDEKRVLELYDRLQELRLEMALLRAQHSYESDRTAQVTEQDIKTAQDELLDSRASYVLRNDVVDSVLTARPILQAVHHGIDATPAERDLLPHIQQRDDTAVAVASQSSALRATLDELTRVEAESVRAARRNADLAAEVLRLAAEATRDRDPAVLGEDAQVKRLEREVKTSRQKWKVIKGTISAVVTGSGVDWARDEGLRELVMDPD